MEGSNQNSGFDSRISSLSLTDDTVNRSSNSGFDNQGVNVYGEYDNGLSMPTNTMEDLNDEKEKEPRTSHQKMGKYFFYDSPLVEDTGVWIPVSIPPMLESDHEQWAKGFHSNGDYFPEGDMGWGEFLSEEKELTMWDVIVEMILAARGKVNALASGDIQRCGVSWLSSHLLEQAWQEMAQTLNEVNLGNVKEILDAEPPKWLADSAASACMLCGVRFHPIMCSRHHCRFCGGIFCGECSKGRSLMPQKFRVTDPQRVCDVCCVRLESVQPYLMDQVSNAAQLPTHDLTDLSTLRSWVNFPWGQSMEHEIYKATNTIRGYITKVGILKPEKSIPDSILRDAKGLAIISVMKVGVMVTYNIGTGLSLVQLHTHHHWLFVIIRKRMVTVEEVRKAQRAQGPATVLAIGTSTPPNCVDQSTYPDYYFRITNSEHKTELKEKFKRMCEKSMIKKRYMYLTEEILKENPNVCEYMAPSLDARQDMVVVEVPKLGKEAATKAIKEWGQPKSKITHLVFCTTSGVDMPGADYQLTKLLGLRPSVKRLMMYQQGCFAGGTVLRVAKDLAENNKGARVLVVCSEITAVTFRGPSDTHLDSLVGQALFGDGAAAVIIGADPVPEIEKPMFELVSAAQTILPDSDGAIDGHLREVGLTFHLLKDVPGLISKNIEKSLVEAFQPLGISDWNSLFWIAHPGGPAILDQVEAKLALKPEKLRATRHVLSEYGNMSSACVLFILDEMRKKSREDGLQTTGEGLEWGVLFGFGPGLTVETVVLHSVAA